MARGFDRVVISVPDVRAAADQYEQLLGWSLRDYDWVTGKKGSGVSWLLCNTVVELLEADVAEAVISGLVLAGEEAGFFDVSYDNSLGLDLALNDGRHSSGHRWDAMGATLSKLSVDHLVLRTDNADACVDLFANELGVRLALDKTVPQWGGRMLFFRAGQMTLEVIESEADGSSGNFFWGIAYQCENIDETVAAMSGRGVVLSEIREGRKPGTRVATIKSHCLGIPTLLIEPVKRDG